MVYVFFFKQKTAYEMRISDWSSDVCSSDLNPHEAGGMAPLAIEGTEGLVLDYARCCYPLPGDEIRGHVSTGRGIVVHRLDCRHARARPQDRVPLTWYESVHGDFLSALLLKLFRTARMLAKLPAEIAIAAFPSENDPSQKLNVLQSAHRLWFGHNVFNP